MDNKISRMRLADFILANVEPILKEWDDFARSLSTGAKLDDLALRNDAEAILRAAALDMGTAQSGAERESKGKGLGGAGGAVSDRLDNASSVHGVGRAGSGFDLDEVVSEYRALRAAVLRRWRASLPEPDVNDLDDITRFNEAIDQSLAMAVASYTQRVDQSRRMFLAILSHDLRNPLNSISLSAQVASAQQELNADSCEALSQIEISVQAISRLVQDLLDFAATGLGARMPLSMGLVSLEMLAREVLAELRAGHPTRTLHLEISGDLTCTCDGPRLRQVFSNLLSNALQHGSEDGPVELSIVGDENEIVFEVQNDGPPIAAHLLPIIFDPLVRDVSMDISRPRRPGSIGLGLYIVHEIVTSHGGTIKATSSADTGTIFRASIPRHQPASE